MPLSIFKYSHISTKIRAKVGRMLNEDDYNEMLNKNTVNDVAEYLKNHTYYSKLLENVDENNVHRGELELVFRKSLLDYAIQFIKFTSGNDNEFLKYIFIRFEIEDLKLMIRLLHIHKELKEIESAVVYLDKYSSVDLNKLLHSTDLESFINNLKGTVYYNVLQPLLAHKDTVNMFTAEMALDMYFFNWVIKAMDKYLSGDNKKIISKTMGTEIDLINMLWIYRCKKYYSMEKEYIFRYLLPYKRRLSKSQLTKMIETTDLQELLNMYSKTAYKEVFNTSHEYYFDRNFWEFILAIQYKALRTNPFTIASIISFFHMQEIELKNVITVIEGIRYNVPKKEINKYIIKFI